MYWYQQAINDGLDELIKAIETIKLLYRPHEVMMKHLGYSL